MTQVQIWIIRVFFTLFGAVFGFTIGEITGGIIGFAASVILAGIESSMPRPLLRDLFACFVGLTFGLIVASLIIYIISQTTDDTINPTLMVSIVIPLAYAGAMIIYRRREAFALFSLTAHGPHSKSPALKILDTSVIIDGRVLDICQTGFIDSIIIIPQFVLNELRHIADSSDLLRRNKGRRGFEILRLMQSTPDIDVEITEEDFPEVLEVDAKLIHLAQKTGGRIITNDFNLNRVAELQGVTVLNINELANSVRPVVVAGEVIQVRVLREGKEPNQGVGYLDDGTMVIVEYGRQYVGQTIEVEVTQTLQTTAGRMIFSRAKSDEVDSNESEDVRSYSRGWQRKPNGASSY